MFHVVTATDPGSDRVADASATGPLITSMTATAEANSKPAKVRTSCSGRSFQTGRPSSIS